MGNCLLCRHSRAGKQAYVTNGGPQTPDDGPPVSPPSKSKERLIPDPSVFRDLDRRVRNTPQFASRSVATLTTSLTRDCPDDLHKVRAFFCWIAANITYDVGAMSTNDVRSQGVDAVLQSRRAVCQGFSQLFQALCQQANIPCQVVSGLDKGVGYDPETVFTAQSKTNHAWNIVFVKGEWRPLDVTWGTGHLDSSRRFQRQFTEHWFLTDPVEFVTDHFPLHDGNITESEKFQLLKRPISIDQFSAALQLKPPAYDIGLQCVTHKHCVIKVRRDVTITLRARQQPLETVRVTLAEKGQGRADCSNILTSLDADGTCKIYVRPPRAGTYVLQMKGKGRGQGESNTVYHMLSYIIKCTEVHKNQERFPDKEETWGLQQPTATDCGLKPVKNAPYSFTAKGGQVTVPVPLSRPSRLMAKLFHADSMAQDLVQYTQVEYPQPTSAIINARLPRPGYYTLQLYASDPKKETRMLLCADFLLHTADKAKSCTPFPETFQFAREQRTRLISPQSAHVPKGQRTLFRVHAPSLGKVRVGDVEMVKCRGGVWEAQMTPAAGPQSLIMYGAVNAKDTSLNGLYQFNVL